MRTVPEISVSSFLANLNVDIPAVSAPVMVLGTDAKTYILKTQKIFNQTTRSYENLNCSFLNEYISFCVGQHIGLPQPDIAIANIRQDFINEQPELFFNNRFTEGEHFASEFMENSERNLMVDYTRLHEEGKAYLKKPWPKFLSNLSNGSDVSLIIAFDLLIANKDRFAHPDNFLLIRDTTNSRRIYAIDHGHAFGSPVWNSTKMEFLYKQHNSSESEYINWYVNQFFIHNQRNAGHGIFSLNGLGNIFQSLSVYIDLSDLSNHSFLEPMRRISSITPSIIDKWIDEIPPTWFLNIEEQSNFYKNFLLNQISLLPNIIQYIANTQGFANYRGGALSWNQINTGIQ